MAGSRRPKGPLWRAGSVSGAVGLVAVVGFVGARAFVSNAVMPTTFVSSTPSAASSSTTTTTTEVAGLRTTPVNPFADPGGAGSGSQASSSAPTSSPAASGSGSTQTSGGSSSAGSGSASGQSSGGGSSAAGGTAGLVVPTLDSVSLVGSQLVGDFTLDGSGLSDVSVGQTVGGLTVVAYTTPVECAELRAGSAGAPFWVCVGGATAPSGSASTGG